MSAYDTLPLLRGIVDDRPDISPEFGGREPAKIPDRWPVSSRADGGFHPQTFAARYFRACLTSVRWRPMRCRRCYNEVRYLVHKDCFIFDFEQ